MNISLFDNKWWNIPQQETGARNLFPVKLWLKNCDHCEAPVWLKISGK